MRKRVSILLLAMLISLSAAAVEFGGAVRMDKTVHDFGKVSIKDGALPCTFTVTNISSGPMTILTVVSTCGCTVAEWTMKSIAPGESGTIEATYRNEDGPYPFDKTLKVYFSNYDKPVVLHLKGVVKKK